MILTNRRKFNSYGSHWPRQELENSAPRPSYAYLHHSDNLNSMSNSISTKLMEERKRSMEEQVENYVETRKESNPNPNYQNDAFISNTISRLGPEPSKNRYWDESTYICRTIPGLTREQIGICFKSPEATKIAVQGVSLATKECAIQMKHHRWNCSSLQENLNPHSTQMFKKGSFFFFFWH